MSGANGTNGLAGASRPTITGTARLGSINIRLTIAYTAGADGLAGSPLSVSIPLDDGYILVAESLGLTAQAHAGLDRTDAALGLQGRPPTDRARVERDMMDRLGPAE